MLRLLKIETFSASKLFALSKQLSHPICLIGIDLVSPFRILEEALSVMIFFFLFLICAVLKMIMESKKQNFFVQILFLT